MDCISRSTISSSKFHAHDGWESTPAVRTKASGDLGERDSCSRSLLGLQVHCPGVGGRISALGTSSLKQRNPDANKCGHVIT